MKNLIAMIMVLAMPCLLCSQDIAETYSTQNINSVELDFNYGDITIKSTTDDQVRITGDVLINGQHLPDHLTISADRQGSKLVIEAELDLDDVDYVMTIIDEDGKKTIKTMGKKGSYRYSQHDDHKGKSVTVGVNVDMDLTVHIPERMLLHSHTLYGSTRIESYFSEMDIEATYGGITAVLDKRLQSPDFSLHSTYGFVDLTIAGQQSTNLTLDTGFGEIFTNMDIDPLKDGKSSEERQFGEYIVTSINGGDGDIRLEANYGNIYLRKG